MKKTESVELNPPTSSVTVPFNNDVLPIHLSVIKPADQFASFDDDVAPQETYMIQENSHLIQFDRCLLGCMFFIKSNEAYYTSDCLSDWTGVIEKFGGQIADDYDKNRDEITHVLCPNRFCAIYKKV